MAPSVYRSIAALLLGVAPLAPAGAEDGLGACRQAAAHALPAPARDVLPRIDGEGRQLLALRSYLRARDLDARWSWSQARIDAYAGSDEQRTAHAEVAKVQSAFAAANPGYSLHVNLQVRSLDDQLRKWNTNASVARAAAALAAAAAEACARQGQAGFGRWLREWPTPSAVTLAAPGLSPHGQGRAYDFQVMRGGTLVAGTDSGSVRSRWVGDGWAGRLAAAVRASGAAFSGPLRSPDEPWHYQYEPPG
ncbi:hypothetical protein [Pseudoxanthomonas sp. 10H]|uniref:hypothetical protein n=1 Tax=Pseudoxanthomonas sp. 10H TaxID=3242729 RepID=UPI0035569D26